MSTGPPGKEKRGPGHTSQDPADKPAAATAASNASLTRDGEVPPSRPWAGRADAPETERRFQCNQAGMRRRIDFARRSAHNAADPIAPYREGWTHWSTPAPPETEGAPL